MARSRQGQGEYQIQTQTQQLTPQQVLLVRLTELPLNDLRERIDKELEDNPWLQGEHPDNPDDGGNAGYQDESPDGGESTDSPELPDYADDADSDDGIPRDPNSGAEERRREMGDDSESFFDHLVGQLGEYARSDHELEVMQYLIG